MSKKNEKEIAELMLEEKRVEAEKREANAEFNKIIKEIRRARINLAMQIDVGQGDFSEGG